MFPNITTPECTAVLWGAPHVMVNGHLYAAATVMQICLYPVDPARAQDLLLRRVSFQTSKATTLSATGAPDAVEVVLGDPFWAGPKGVAPTCQAAGAAAAGVRTLAEMGAEVRADVAALHAGATPCSSTAPGEKCEACVGGCEPLGPILNGSIDNQTACRVVLPWAERTHYTLPQSARPAQNARQATDRSDGDGGDIILYRTLQRQLCYSHRPLATHAAADRAPWSVPQPAGFTDVDTNLNAGSLYVSINRIHDHRAYDRLLAVRCPMLHTCTRVRVRVRACVRLCVAMLPPPSLCVLWRVRSPCAHRALTMC